MDSAAKLSKSFEKGIIEVLLLYMVISGKINFTQMGKYGRHGEQCYRQHFGRLCSKSLNWLHFNVSLALRYFGSDSHCPLTTSARLARRLRILVVFGRDVPVP